MGELEKEVKRQMQREAAKQAARQGCGINVTIQRPNEQDPRTVHIEIAQLEMSQNIQNLLLGIATSLDRLVDHFLADEVAQVEPAFVVVEDVTDPVLTDPVDVVEQLELPYEDEQEKGLEV